MSVCGHHVCRPIVIVKGSRCRFHLLQDKQYDLHGRWLLLTAFEREREESPHIDRVRTTGRSFLWKNLYNTMCDRRLSSVVLHVHT